MYQLHLKTNFHKIHVFLTTSLSPWIYFSDNGSGQSTLGPVVVTTAAPATQAPQCQTKWSTWINTDNPTSDDMEREHWTAVQKLQFCPGTFLLFSKTYIIFNSSMFTTTKKFLCSAERPCIIIFLQELK